jgi:hypothetical protein
MSEDQFLCQLVDGRLKLINNLDVAPVNDKQVP